MWENIVGRIPSFAILICALLSALIPLCIYNINKVIHKHGDPPWKKEDKNTKKGNKNSPN